MARTKKNNVTLDVDSALALMQETYNDIVEQKNMAALIMKKMLKYMKESEDMTMIGPVIKDQQKLMNDCIEKKLSIVKLQGVLLKQTGGSTPTSGGKLELTAEERAMIQGLVKEPTEGKEPPTETYN